MMFPPEQPVWKNNAVLLEVYGHFMYCMKC